MKSFSTKAVVMAIAGFSCVMFAWYFGSTKTNITSTSNQPTDPGPHLSSSFPPSESPQQVVTEPQQNPRKTLAMAKAFYASKDLRAFAEMAKNHPDEGGVTYALSAVGTCARVKNIPDIKADNQADSITYGKKVSALNDLRYRCQGFSSKEISAEGMGNLYRLRKEGKDILANNENSLQHILGVAGQSRAITADQRIQFLNELSQLQDPESIGTFGREMITYANTEGNKGFWINGKPYFSEAQVALVNDAWDWAPCAMDADCGANSTTLEMYCAEQGKCFDNISDYYKAGVYADNPKGYEELVSVKNKIVDAIQHRNFGTLLKPQ